MIHLPVRFRVLVTFSVIMIGGAVFFIMLQSKAKTDYENVTGHITYLSAKMGELPTRDLGKYRYLKIENYPYPFEIYADEQGKKMDSLKVGDNVSAYFYETNFIKEDSINRYLQYLETNNKIVYKAGNFQKAIGYTVISLLIMFIGICYILYKKKKIAY